MGNKRIYEIAKEVGLKSKDIQERLEQMGIEVKSASSTITSDQYSAFRQRFPKLFKGEEETPEPTTGTERVIVRGDEEGQKERLTERRVSRTVIRRRSRGAEESAAVEVMAEEAPEAEAAPAAEAAPEAAEAKPAAPQAEVPAPDEEPAPAAAQAPEQPAAEEPAPVEAAEPEKADAAPPAKKPAPEEQAGMRLLKVVDSVKGEFKPRVEQPIVPPSQEEAPGDRTAEAKAKAKAAAQAAEVERKAKAGRRHLKEQQAEQDWRDTKRMLAKRREFEFMETLAPSERSYEGGGRRPRRKRGSAGTGRRVTTVEPVKRKPIRIEKTITITDLAGGMGVKAAELVRKLMEMDIMVTANQAIDFETAELLASDYDVDVERVGIQEEEIFRAEAEEAVEENLVSRPPVVTIMGHVDHGKTSLLDKIRATKVAEGEAGGITQHIGAYHVDTSRGPVTFLDTPGHEAFTAMRARGANVTDVAVIVVAADDGVMPQTREAVNHAKAAGVPIIVAVNKIDKPEAKPERVRQQLTELELVPEEWGGETLFVDVSAKTGAGLDNLLENIALQSELLELKANPERSALGVVIEAKLEKGRGAVATILIQNGTLHQGDHVVAGPHYGRARALTDDRGRRVKEVGPGMPVEILGLGGVPSAGDVFDATDDEKLAKQVAEKRSYKRRESEMAAASTGTLEALYAKIEKGEIPELNVVLKADVQGSLEAVVDQLMNLSGDQVKVRIIHQGVGAITESDVMLASASEAMIIGFNIRPDRTALDVADQQKVQTRTYSVIYELIDEVRKAMEGLLTPEFRENIIGHAEIREVFSISKLGKVAGCYVTDGRVSRASRIRVMRDGEKVHEGELASLKRFKDDVREVKAGFECGLNLKDFNDIRVGDVLEAYELEEVAPTLVTASERSSSETTAPPAP